MNQKNKNHEHPGNRVAHFTLRPKETILFAKFDRCVCDEMNVWAGVKITTEVLE